MSRFDPYLKSYAESNGTRVHADIANAWKSIRGANLYAGGPRSSKSEQSIARALAALRLASQTNDVKALAEACRLMAHSLNVDEQCPQSIDYYQKAIALFERFGDGEQAARTRLGFIAALYMTGKYDEALEAAALAEKWFQANNHASGLAKLYSNIGNLNYRREHYREALLYHRKARALFEELKDWNALAMNYLNIANGLSFTEQLDEAEKMYNLAEELSKKLNMQELFMQARYNKSYLMFLQGRNLDALEAFSAVREYFVQTASYHHVHLCDLDIAEVYLHLVQPEEALESAKRAAAGFEPTLMRYEHAKSLAFSAMALAQLDMLQEAEQAASTARALFEAEKNQYWISVVDFCLAYVRMASGDVAKGRMLAAQANLQFQTLDTKGAMTESLDRIGSMTFEPTQRNTAAACMSEVLKLTINKRH